MREITKHRQIVVVILLILFLFPQTAYMIDVLHFGVPSKKVGISMLEAWQPIITELSEVTKIPIELIITKDHKTMIEEMKKGSIDLGYFSPVPYVMARKEFNCEPLVMRVLYGSSYYQAGIIVPEDSKINSLQDLKGKVVALTAYEDSTSGFFVPLAMFKEAGLDYEEDFKEIIHTGKHINVLKTVSFGEVDAGAIKTYILNDPENEKFKDKIRIIAYSRFLPGSPIAIRPELSGYLKEEIREALLNMSSYKKGRQALSFMNFDGFVISHDDLYNPIRKYLDIIDFDY